ncbi:TPA: hypothetical protein QDZ75_004195 [Stenotrophomonas maltophilia]|nr:hypothetical protein [Stenotrophomonas maltophilia]
MDKTFEVEVVRLLEQDVERIQIRVHRSPGAVILAAASDYGTLRSKLNLLPSEAVTIGEQLIAAGRVEDAA